MANRDKSQNAGFVYTNIYQLYKKAQNATPSISSDSRVWRADAIGDIKISKFEPRTLAPARPVLATAAAATAAAPNPNPFDDLKQNMAKLQDLHSKLRFMLRELEDLVGKK